MTKTVLMKVISVHEAAKHFLDTWIFNYGLPTDLIVGNGLQFTSKFFLNVFRIINGPNSFKTTNHSQKNGKLKTFNRTIITALHAYINAHPKDWDLYTSALTYA